MEKIKEDRLVYPFWKKWKKLDFDIPIRPLP